MLISETTKTKWNASNVKYYKSKGYIYTKIGDEFEVKVGDLSKGSTAKVESLCDYCKKNKIIKPYHQYLSCVQNAIIKKDCCKECTHLKQDESNLLIYGFERPSQIEEFKKKLCNIMIEKYGCESYFKTEEFKEKKKITSNKKYGVDFPSQSEVIKNKIKETCLDRYGVEVYTQRKEYRISVTGKNSVRYNPKITDKERIQQRFHPEYIKWRKAVYKRDNYTCQCCGDNKGGNLNAHHLENFADNLDLRFDVDNGITLCKKHHDSCFPNSFHNIYGTKHNTRQQFEEYLIRYKNGEFEN